MIIANNSDSLHYTLSSEATSAISKESYDKILYYSLDLLVNKKNYKKICYETILQQTQKPKQIMIKILKTVSCLN